MMPNLALVVDAEPALCEILYQALKPAGIEDLTLTSSADAVDHLLTTKFGVVLVNLRDSPLHGVELTERIRKSGCNRLTPVILMSGEQSKGSLPRGFSAGASFFVHMPMETDRLTRLIIHLTTTEQRARRFRRVSERVRVLLASAHLQLEGETIDLSLGGMLVRVPRMFPLGALMEVSLYPASTVEPIVGLGSVTRVTGSNVMGVQIDRLTIEQSRRLQDYLLGLFVV
jgi:DNA-binding response OmpR family regulator